MITDVGSRDVTWHQVNTVAAPMINRNSVTGKGRGCCRACVLQPILIVKAFGPYTYHLLRLSKRA